MTAVTAPGVRLWWPAGPRRRGGRLRAVLDGVRAAGFALVDQELELGLRSMAVPLHRRGGEVVAAMNISAPLERGTVDAITAELLPPLLEAAAALEADLLTT